MIEAYNENIWVTEEFGKHRKGQEISVHMDTGFIRTEYVPKDGRTDISAIKNYGSLQVAVYEPGVGTGY